VVALRRRLIALSASLAGCVWVAFGAYMWHQANSHPAAQSTYTWLVVGSAAGLLTCISVVLLATAGSGRAADRPADEVEQGAHDTV
jgi:hypothetical protein